MSALDLGVVAVLALSGLFAFARGFVREALSIVAWVGAAAIAVYGFNDVYRFALKFITTPLLAQLVVGAGLFLTSLIVLTMLTGYAARFVQKSAASPIDRTLGLIFGVARGAVLVSLAYLLLNIALPPNDRPSWITEAKVTPYLAQGADMLRSLLPASWQVQGASTVDAARHALDQASEAQRAMRAMENPAAPQPTAPDQPDVPDYKDSERHDMDRLIQNAR
jgi:membrane protein required for colicin V production